MAFDVAPLLKPLILVFALLIPASSGSLGIGIDVFPEAFTFAARRVGLAADLRLTSCTASRCLWSLGDGVWISADQTGESLDIYRIEAALEQAPSPVSADHYEKACLAIVALVEHHASPYDLRVAVEALVSPANPAPRRMRINSSNRTINLYSSSVPEGNDTHLVARRCGAIAS